MKKLLFLFLLTPQVIFTQQIVALDSLDILDICQWEKSAGKLREQGKIYDVFRDKETDELFTIRRKYWFFTREEITYGK